METLLKKIVLEKTSAMLWDKFRNYISADLGKLVENLSTQWKNSQNLLYKILDNDSKILVYQKMYGYLRYEFDKSITYAT